MAKRQLTDRFEKVIGGAVVQTKLRDGNSYLAEWRRGDPLACGDDLDAEAAASAAQLKTYFDDRRLQHLIVNRGRA